MSTPGSEVRMIPIKKAALYGALLSGTVAFMQGVTMLAAFGIRLESVGFFKNGVDEVLFAALSLIALVLVSLLVAGAGAATWAGGSFVWNRHVGPKADKSQDPPSEES